MDPLPVVEHLKILNDGHFRCRLGSTGRPVNPLRLEETVPGFHEDVIIAMPLPTHARGHTVWLEAFLVPRGGRWWGSARAPARITRSGVRRRSTAYSPRFRVDPVLPARSSKPALLVGDIRDIRHPHGMRAIRSQGLIQPVLLHRECVARKGSWPDRSASRETFAEGPASTAPPCFGACVPLLVGARRRFWGGHPVHRIRPTPLACARPAEPGVWGDDGPRPQTRCTRPRESGTAS
jgi:hypothetical protein